jgi:hypothetical protein
MVKYSVAMDLTTASTTRKKPPCSASHLYRQIEDELIQMFTLSIAEAEPSTCLDQMVFVSQTVFSLAGRAMREHALRMKPIVSKRYARTAVYIYYIHLSLS